VGGFLAILVLFLSLRSVSSTLIIAVATPLSVVGTFVVMMFMGRTINVISLAGMAFAVGLIIDNSIVVLENIYRHMEMGKSRLRASYDGTVEVWGALVANTLTTTSVFIPIIFVEDQAGQLFKDIAIAITVTSLLSLVISITLIPALTARTLSLAEKKEGSNFSNLWGYADKTTGFADWTAGLVKRI
jgi:HAE1 family hydrophobic/amphiphilic exporter-1